MTKKRIWIWVYIQKHLETEYTITLKHFLIFIGLAFVIGVIIGMFGSWVAWLIVALFIMVLAIFIGYKILPLFQEPKESTC